MMPTKSREDKRGQYLDWMGVGEENPMEKARKSRKSQRGSRISQASGRGRRGVFEDHQVVMRLKYPIV